MNRRFLKSPIAVLMGTVILLALANLSHAQTWTYHENFVDDAGNPDPGDWTARDFNAAGSEVPYFETQSNSGRTVLWCGKNDPNYAGGSGYGNSWNMWVEKEFTQPAVWGEGNPGRIAFDIQYDTETDYDWVYVMVSYDGRTTWDYMAAFTGQSGGFEHHELNWEAWAVGPPVWIRFAFVSDFAWSDEDGIFPTDGAFRLDNVQLIDIRDASVRDESNFDTGLDGWMPGVPPPPQPLYALQPFEFWSDYGPRPDGVEFAWTAIQAPNGVFPPQPGDQPWWNTGIESPRIEIPADADTYTLIFDVFRQLPFAEQLFYGWQVAAPAPEDGGSWGDLRISYGVDAAWYRRVWDITQEVTPGATSMRVRLMALYYPNYVPSDGVFTGPGPIFGAVTLEAQTTTQNGALAGRVYQAEISDCPAPGTGLYGVTVNLFDGSGGAVASLVTDTDGNFAATDLSAGQYQVSLVRPLGYGATSDDLTVIIAGGETTTADFALTCLPATGDVRTIGYWKHQVNAAAGGGGLGCGQGMRKGDPPPDEIDSPVCDLLDLIVQHFNDNAVNQVRIFEPVEEATCREKLELALSLLNLHGNQEMIARARQQLMALLLNGAAGFINLTTVVSEDGATLSQAITFCDNLIDDPSGDHELAMTTADEINNGRTVPAGWIPLDTIDIAYRQPPVPSGFQLENAPNPFNPFTKISFSLASGSSYRLSIYDSAGKLVILFSAVGSRGPNEVVWNGTNQRGLTAGSGVYFYSLESAGRRETKKMVLLK